MIVSKERFITQKDAEMQAAILAIPELLYTGSRDTYDADLVEVGNGGASFAHPYQHGPRLQAEDTDSGSVFTMLSSLSPIDSHSRTMAFSASVSESARVSPSSLPPELQERLQDRGLVDPKIEITKMWAYSVSARQGELDRNAHTTVTIGTRSVFLYPNVPLADQRLAGFPLELISRAELSQLPIPSCEELNVQRFNRIVIGLGFSALQVS